MWPFLLKRASTLGLVQELNSLVIVFKIIHSLLDVKNARDRKRSR